MSDVRPIPLEYALNGISHVFHILTPADVIPLAALDPHGGYHAAYDDGFPSGSLWRVEGQALYALIRALKPQAVLELGTWHGASATHILQGVADNKAGGLTCIDSRAYGDIEIGGMIPQALKPLAILHDMRIEAFIPQALKEGWTYDFIFEDAMHDAEQVEFVWKHADKLLNPGGVIISHDACHAIAGEAVREGITKAGYEDTMGYGNGMMYVLIAPADCGFALYRKGL